MIASYDKFKQIIEDTKNAGVIYSYLNDYVKPPYDYSDLLRWQLAQAVSALDKLIHDLVRIGMLEIFKGKRPITPKYQSFSVTLDVLNNIKLDPSQELSLIEKQIMLNNGYKSFQDPDKIADALSLIWNESNKWEKIASTIGSNSSSVKTLLKNIVIRRNQIVHEGDYNGYLFSRENILEADVSAAVTFVEKLGQAIYTNVG